MVGINRSNSVQQHYSYNQHFSTFVVRKYRFNRNPITVDSKHNGVFT